MQHIICYAVWSSAQRSAGFDSSTRFPSRAQTDKQTDRRMQLNAHEEVMLNVSFATITTTTTTVLRPFPGLPG